MAQTQGFDAVIDLGLSQPYKASPYTQIMMSTSNDELTASDPPVAPILAPLCAVFRRHLTAQSLRYTPERAEVLAAVMETDGLFEADALRDQLRTDGKDVSKATVYRTLRLLQDAGIIVPIMLLEAKQTHYQLAYGSDPYDLMVCMETGQINTFRSAAVAAIRDELVAEAGWKAVGHRFVIYGLSPEAGGGIPAPR